jgi:hypothetical protein
VIKIDHLGGELLRGEDPGLVSVVEPGAQAGARRVASGGAGGHVGGQFPVLVVPACGPQELAAAAIGDGARAKCSKRPASFWAEDKAVPVGSVVAVVVAESPD